MCGKKDRKKCSQRFDRTGEDTVKESRSFAATFRMKRLRDSSFFIKDTQAEPAAVPTNGIMIPKRVSEVTYTVTSLFCYRFCFNKSIVRAFSLVSSLSS